MRIVNFYIGRNLFLTMAITLAVLTFVMLAGHLVQALFFTAKGMSPIFLLRYLMYMLPDILCYILPVAILCSTILVFGRMSEASEITALKSCGISLWQIISPALMLAILTSVFCIYLQCVVKPDWKYKAVQLKSEVNVTQPIKLLEAGRLKEFSTGGSDAKTFFCYVQRINGERLENIRIHVLDKSGDMVLSLFASSGEIIPENTPEYADHYPYGALVLSDVFIGRDDLNLSKSGIKNAKISRFIYPIEKEMLQARRLVKRAKYLTWREILARIVILKDSSESVNDLYLELSERLSLAISPIAFVFLGIPFGIRSRRSEVSVSVVTAFMLAGLFFIFFLCGGALKKVGMIAILLVWLPNLLYQISGILSLRKLEKR